MLSDNRSCWHNNQPDVDSEVQTYSRSRSLSVDQKYWLNMKNRFKLDMLGNILILWRVRYWDIFQIHGHFNQKRGFTGVYRSRLGWQHSLTLLACCSVSTSWAVIIDDIRESYTSLKVTSLSYWSWPTVSLLTDVINQWSTMCIFLLNVSICVSRNINNKMKHQQLKSITN